MPADRRAQWDVWVGSANTRFIRTAMWGALLIWIGLMGIIDEAPGVAGIGAGAILLTAALFRKAMGGRAGFILSLTGILLVAIGISDLSTDERRIPLFAVALIAFGAMIVVRALGARRWLKNNVTEIRINLPDDKT